MWHLRDLQRGFISGSVQDSSKQFCSPWTWSPWRVYHQLNFLKVYGTFTIPWDPLKFCETYWKTTWIFLKLPETSMKPPKALWNILKPLAVPWDPLKYLFYSFLFLLFSTLCYSSSQKPLKHPKKALKTSLQTSWNPCNNLNRNRNILNVPETLWNLFMFYFFFQNPQKRSINTETLLNNP